MSRVEPGIVGEFCQALQGSHARILLPVRQSFLDARWCGWDDTQKGEVGSKLICSPNGWRQAVERCVSEVCRKQECAVRGGRSKPGAAIGVWPKGQDWTICLAENLLCDGAEKQLGYAVPSVCADDEEICALLSDDLLQFRPRFTPPNNEFVSNASKSP